MHDISTCSVCLVIVCLGAVHIHHCTLNPRIPVWVIVFGVAQLVVLFFSMCSLIWNCIAARQSSSSDRTCYGNVFDIFNVIMALFIFAWLVVGSIWTFPLYRYTSTVYVFTPLRILVLCTRQWNSQGRPACSGMSAASPMMGHCCDPTIYLFGFSMIIIGWIYFALVILGFCMVVCCAVCCATLAASILGSYEKLEGASDTK